MSQYAKLAKERLSARIAKLTGNDNGITTSTHQPITSDDTNDESDVNTERTDDADNTAGPNTD